jgi:hypothetical protein
MHHNLQRQERQFEKFRMQDETEQNRSQMDERAL